MRIPRLPTLLAACALHGAAHAQVVNVQPLLGVTTEDGLHVEATAGGSLLTGNTPLLTARGALLVRHRVGRHTIISSSRVEFGRGRGDPFLNRQTTHLRYQNRLTERLTWEAYAQAAHDAVWRLELRALGGTGARIRLWSQDDLQVVTGLGYLLEQERLSRGEFTDSGLVRLNHRLGSYATVVWRVDPPLSLAQTVYFQPRFDDPSDLRLLSHTALVMRIRERLAVSTTVQIAWNTWTPETILPLDTTSAVELTWAF